jgi:tRNA G10  N-methylase Trm11
MQSLMVLGRQPALGLAELESIYGAGKLQPVGEQAVIVDVDPCLLAFDRLGGSTKFCKLLTILDTTDWKEIEKFLLKVSPGHSQQMPEGKMQLGLSVIGLDVSLGKLEATGLTLKKAIRKTGRPVRLVPNKTAELNAAQVIHNKLTGPNGWELVFIRNGKKTVVAQTVKVQDIESYTRRDRERPKRDAKVGMLPPKLAQIIINLSVGRIGEDVLQNICDIPAGQEIPRPMLEQTILDPFCGTGVLLQEAALMGYHAYGSDLEPRMVEYSQANLEWLAMNFKLAPACCRLEAGDATTHKWHPPIDFVAAEAYLGRPFTAKPIDEILAQTVSDTNLILKKFLKNIGPQVKAGTRLCLAVPAWQTRPNQFKKLPLIDQISDLGYNLVRFEHASDDELVYYRPDQIVARQLLVITRK